MPSYSLVAFMGLSILVASSGALPQPSHDSGPGPAHGPFKGPPHGPHPTGTFIRPATGISGSPIFPTGTFPTGFIPSGTASNGFPVFPAPTDSAEDFELVKRFEGPRVGGPKRPWHHYKPQSPRPSGDTPKPPHFPTGGPFPSGTQGPPIVGPTGGPPSPGPTAH